MPKYLVSKWDPIDEPWEETEAAKIGDCRWFEFASALTRWGVRQIVRELMDRGYDLDVSILVEVHPVSYEEVYA